MPQVLRLERAAPGAVERGEEREAAGSGPHWDLLNRSRPSVGIDLKNPDAVELVLGLVEQADGLRSRASGPAWPSGWASGPRPASPATGGWSTGA